MDAVKLLIERRSVRKYKPEIVDKAIMRDIAEVAKFAPSWANLQIARYTFITDENIIASIAKEGVNGFSYNVKTLNYAKNVAILSYVKGKSGKLHDEQAGYATSKGQGWEMFDAGIACQTFCLAAHEKGVGTCIFGIIDDEAIAKIIDLPDDETVAAVITYGYPIEEREAPPRLDVDEIVRFI